jgi:branched-chain amino acid transport system substrate-binding protein
MRAEFVNEGKLRSMIAPGRAALRAAILWLFAACVCAQGVTPHTVVLGQSAPLSGPHQALGEELRSGALAYLRKLNDAGGLYGRRVELATLDDAGDPGRALANTHRFIEEFGVFALFGYPGTSLTREVLDLLQRTRTPLFGARAGAQLVRRPGRLVFTVSAGYADEIDQVVDYFARLGQKRFALVRRDDAAGAELVAAARQALERRGLAAPADALVAGAAAGAAAALREAFVADPDVIVVALPQPPAADLIRELRQSRGTAQIVALSLADPAALAQALGPAGAGVVMSQVVPPLDHIALPVVAEYRAAYAAERGREAYSPASLEAYIAAKVLVEAMRRAGRALTRDSLLLALDAMAFDDAGGYVVSFSRTRRQGSARIYPMVLDRDGQLLH